MLNMLKHLLLTMELTHLNLNKYLTTSFGNLSFGLSTATISPDISGGVLSVNVNNYQIMT